MFKSLTIALTCVLTTTAFAKSVSTITCSITEEKKKVKVEFLIQDLGSKKAELIKHPKLSEDDYGAILVTPKEINNRFSVMNTLNDQGGDLRVGEDRIRLFGDGDGYTFVDLVLFKDTGYQKGYVRVSGSGDQMYQKINCQVK